MGELWRDGKKCENGTKFSGEVSILLTSDNKICFELTNKSEDITLDLINPDRADKCLVQEDAQLTFSVENDKCDIVDMLRTPRSSSPRGAR